VVNETIGAALRGGPKLLGAVSQEEMHEEMGGGTDTQCKSQSHTTALISTLVHCSLRAALERYQTQSPI
jgi:hypothetical protein